MGEERDEAAVATGFQKMLQETTKTQLELRAVLDVRPWLLRAVGALRSFTWMIKCACLLSFLGCVSSPERPIPAPRERLDFQGFSIVPPRGPNWFVTPPALRSKQGPYVIVSFYKLPSSPTHTILAVVRGGRIDGSGESAEQLLQRLSEAPPESKRYRIVSRTLTADSSLKASCTRYDIVSEDRDVPGYPDVPFVGEQHGLVCVHPEIPGAALSLEYSDRRRADEAPSAIGEEGDEFLRSIMFTPLRGG